jgi:hypothetical protein
MTDEEVAETIVKRNVEHLEIMVAKEWWGDEDMTAANACNRWIMSLLLKLNNNCWWKLN